MRWYQKQTYVVRTKSITLITVWCRFDANQSSKLMTPLFAGVTIIYRTCSEDNPEVLSDRFRAKYFRNSEADIFTKISSLFFFNFIAAARECCTSSKILSNVCEKSTKSFTNACVKELYLIWSHYCDSWWRWNILNVQQFRVLYTQATRGWHYIILLFSVKSLSFKVNFLTRFLIGWQHNR